MASYIQRLPAVFRTTTEKQFFDATFDQVFSKKDSDYLAGYLGRRNPGYYNPISDFYIPEPTKNRTWWQLEATVFARNPDSSKTNIFFYEDLLNRINYYGGNTLNQDRLFESEYYSFGPPIDYDMFINYQNYYWIESGLPAITIIGVMGSDIIGQSSYTTPNTATPPNLTLSTGMTVILASDPLYTQPHTIENIGGCIGIRLIQQFSNITPGTTFEFLPWDGSVTLSTGRTITNTNWDENTWDTEAQPTTGDYITIERGSVDENAWSRTNKWFYINTINTVLQITGGNFPANATRALRPIIQFVADLILFNSGTQFRAEINYGFRDNQFGQPIKLSDLQSQNINFINTTYNVSISNGTLVGFFNDSTPITADMYPWDDADWDELAGDLPEPWDAGIQEYINKYIWVANVLGSGEVIFTPYPNFSTPIVEGDIVLIEDDAPYDGALRGQSWYYSQGIWQEVFNDKIALNQAPLFQLYDHNGIELNDPITYPSSTFEGSKIFSYEVNTTPGATSDPILGFPIVYTSLGQATDIVFENNLITDRYTYGAFLPINGYYYYKASTNPVLFNSWNLYNLYNCMTPPTGYIPTSKQRVIDQYVVGFGSLYQFQLSVTPADWPTTPDIIVSVNGIEIYSAATQLGGYTFSVINNSIYVDLTTYLTNLLSTPQTVAPVVEIQTYTYSDLNPAATGYFSIPQQLEANPDQTEVDYISGSDLVQQFSSIISNQIGFSGNSFGGTNNYLDSRKNRSLGLYILQNVAPTLKSMLVSSSDDLDFIQGIRFSQNEYTKFKNQYITVGLQLINQEFDPVQYINNSVVISSWVDQILKTINISKEYSNAFAYSYMVASGTPSFSETHILPANGSIILTNYIDLSDPKNVMYVYNATNPTLPLMLLVGEDYTITSTNLTIDVQFNGIDDVSTITFINGDGTTVTIDHTGASIPPIGSSVTVSGVTGTTAYNGTYVVVSSAPGVITVSSSVVGIGVVASATVNALKTFIFYLYQNPLPTYIPSTPSKLGTYPTYIPRIELDTSYVIPTNVVIGHDGSKTIAFGDYRDMLLLELERRIYNGIQSKFRNEYYVPLRVESVKSGHFRQTRYSRSEYLNITESYINKWSAMMRANYRNNDWPNASVTCPVPELWKLYNYSPAVNALGQELNLPGNWKGIFQYYYDTFYPDIRPWEMLGFSQQPIWWVSQYGPGILNANSQIAWPNTLAYALMWSDLEAGIIRQGPTAIYDPETLEPQPQLMWARPGLSSIIPVDASGNIISVPILFGVALSGNPYEPFDGFNNDWVYGDGAPVEQAWMSTSAYDFNVQEFLYLMRPGPFGELLWDTLGTTVSPGQLTILGIESPVLSNNNWQYVQNDTYTSTDPFFAWMRPKNVDQFVHAENVDSIIQIRCGYQCWISDRILFIGKNIGDTFGQKIRTLDVNLANKLAGFTNKDTTNLYIESITPGATTNTLLVPSTNFDVQVYASQPIATYSYSGVIIRALANGTFAIYGYDLLGATFTTLDRTTNQLINVSVGGTPADFQYFTAGTTYNVGDIVRYNGVYYESLAAQTVDSFNSANWLKLKALPVTGGISVIYKPISASTTTNYPYGSILKTPQDVFDFLIGWGAYLESQGWQFQDVNSDTNQVNDWLNSAKQFLFWLNTSWAPDASIQLSPSANSATLIVNAGYPDDVETLTNGVYSILDKLGVAIAPNNTTVDRAAQSITVSPSNLATGGIFFLQVSATETEHVMIIDNTTSFNDVVYDPLLRARQQRLRFNGFRSNGWYGKMEAPGYLIIDNQLVPNYDTIVDSMRYYYDPNVIIDNPSLEALGRHLIGYESKSYLDNLQVSNDVQYLFYQGAIRQKGTEQALEKLFRSTYIQANDVITVYEEWALKLGEFGNTIEQVSTEFILRPEQNTGEVIVARLNFVPSKIGFIREINILNAQDTYTIIPKIVISPPDANPNDPALTQPLRQATAYAVLDSTTNTISRIDIIDPGYGYLVAPDVTINSGSQPNNLDILYAVWQGQIIIDTSLDNIVDISIDDENTWTVRPIDPSFALEFPLTPVIDYNIPTAGYVNFNDITFSVFDVATATTTWGNVGFNPLEDNSIWIANNFTQDWGVYKLVDAGTDFGLEQDAAGNLLLFTPSSYLLAPQFSTTGNITDLGNIICLQVIEAQASVDPVHGITLGVITTITLDKTGNNYTSVPSVMITGDGVNATAVATIAGGVVTGFIITNGGTGYTHATVTIAPPTAVSGDTNYAVGFTFNAAQTQADPTHNYYDLVTLSGNPISATNIPEYANFTKLMLFKTLRFRLAQTYVQLVSGQVAAISILDGGAGYTNVPAVTIVGNGTGATATAIVSEGVVIGITINTPGSGYTTATAQLSLPQPSYVSNGDKVWVDNFGSLWNGSMFVPNKLPLWTVFSYNGLTYLPFRQQQPLINSSLFQSASVFNTNGTELVQLPIYDPFKGIFPGPAKQNITYMTLHDPATYNVTADPTLFSENITFANKQVGQLWWDLSSTRYVYYEQPIALDGSETANDNLVYRRNNWASLFPGSTIAIYEWVSSTVPPAQYTGTGIPRDTTSYVQITNINQFTNINTTTYYFWVLNTTDQPNIENRTLPAIDVSSLLQSPKSQGFSFFCPIQQTETNNSYIFYNVQQILAYQGDNVQIQYRVAERDDQKHAQWMFFREGDSGSLVTDQYWNKMVDSLCGYTELLPITNEFQNGIIIADYLPWDVFGWDISPWDDATSTTTPVYGQVLPVPDPILSPIEQLGILYRPRQTMFFNLEGARKVFVQAANALLQYIPIRDNNPSWNANVPTDIYWTYTNWYAVGYENSVPSVVYPTLVAANTALTSGQLQVGEIIQVTNGTTDGRYTLYVVIQPNPNLPTLTLNQIGIQDSAILLLNTIYTVENIYNLSTELRALMNAFRTTVMINAYLVDQNELYFSMLNYVLSEQKNPDWLFRSSYIYIKENNLPLSQDTLYVPDQINNIIDYIIDSKPYHTQIRDYTSSYVTMDVTPGVPSDTIFQNYILQFGPNFAGNLYTVPSYIIDAEGILGNLDQYISQEQIYTVPLTTPDPNKKGYSQLYPYTFNFNSLNLNNPQTFITPYNVIGVQVGTTILNYGEDYYVVDNNDGTFTAYFYNNPGNSPVPVALVWWEGGSLLTMNQDTFRAETANGFATSDVVMNGDTKLPVNQIAGVYSAFNDMWDAYDPIISAIVVGLGGEPMGFGNGPYDQNDLSNTVLLNNIISFKENTNLTDGNNFYRNTQISEGSLVNDLPAPTAATENLDVITVFVDPTTHPYGTDILPDPITFAPAIWINGERIQYRMKTQIAPNTWKLQLIDRGTMGTAAVDHPAMIPMVTPPHTLVPNPVWIEQNNIMPPTSNIDVWNALNPLPIQIDAFDMGNGGSGYVNGTYTNVPLIGGSGSGAQATIVVSGGSVSAVVLTTGGSGYMIGDILSTSNTNLGGSGSGFNIQIIPPDLNAFDNINWDPYDSNVTSVPLGGLWYAQTPEAIFLKAGQGQAIP
jgi:hypothetical protein